MKSKFLADFKAFAMRGNVIDMAVGVIIGGAFGKIVSSLVNDIIMPLIGIVVGSPTSSGLSHLRRSTKPAMKLPSRHSTTALSSSRQSISLSSRSLSL